MLRSEIDRETAVAVVIAALRETLDRDLPELDENTRLFDDLAVDSTSMLGLLVVVEDALGVEIDPNTASEEQLATIGGFADCALAAVRDR